MAPRYKKENAHIDIWLKNIAPSSVLRQWFKHEAAKWPDFTRKYKEELQQSGMLEELAAIAGKHKTVTLLYGAKDEKYNQAIALLQFLKEAGYKV